MTDPTPIDFAAAVAATGAVVAAVHDGQLTGATPSRAYTVGDLLSHVDDLSLALQSTARKEAPRPGAPAPADGDAARLVLGWRERIPAQLADLARAWRDPEAWEGQTEAGGVPLDGAAAGLFALDEVVVHGWELAVATGQAYESDDAAAVACADFLAGIPRSPDLFGPVVDVPDGASALGRLVGLTGRDPAWRPGAAAGAPGTSRPSHWRSWSDAP